MKGTWIWAWFLIGSGNPSSHSRSLWGEEVKAPTANVPCSNDTSRTIGRSSNYLSSSEQQETANPDMSMENGRSRDMEKA